MKHCEPGQLARAAVGEPIPEDDSAHLRECMWCGAELGSMAAVVEALSVPEANPAIPDARVWQAIAADTGVTADPGELFAPEPDDVRLPEMPMPGMRRPDRAEVQVPASREGDDSDVWDVDVAVAEYADEPISWENPVDRPHTPIAVTTPGAGAGVPTATASPINRRERPRWHAIAAAAAVALAVGGVGGVAVGRSTQGTSSEIVCPKAP